MEQHHNQPWLDNKNFKSSTTILDIQYPEDMQGIERTIERLIMTGKTVAVGLKGSQNPKVTGLKKLSSCTLKIEEGIKLLNGQNNPKAAGYVKELTELKKTLNKGENAYAKEHSISWWEWVLVFLIPYWWILLIIGIGVFLLIQFS